MLGLFTWEQVTWYWIIFVCLSTAWLSFVAGTNGLRHQRHARCLKNIKQLEDWHAAWEQHTDWPYPTFYALRVIAPRVVAPEVYRSNGPVDFHRGPVSIGVIPGTRMYKVQYGTDAPLIKRAEDLTEWEKQYAPRIP